RSAKFSLYWISDVCSSDLGPIIYNVTVKGQKGQYVDYQFGPQNAHRAFGFSLGGHVERSIDYIGDGIIDENRIVKGGSIILASRSVRRRVGKDVVSDCSHD